MGHIMIIVQRGNIEFIYKIGIKLKVLKVTHSILKYI